MAEAARAAPTTAPGQRYPVMERFLTLQGEGFWTGSAAWFIRLGGCNVGCHWCDVKESWPMAGHPEESPEALADEALASGAPRVVITGGEPTLHPLSPLVKALQRHGLRVHLETAGTNPLDAEPDWITLSPKKFRPALPQLFARAHELKVIVHHRHDLHWAQQQAQQVGPQCVLFLQPEWGTPQAPQWIVDFVKQNPAWRASLQTHKFLNIP